jgi:hypothetical protein
VSLSSGLGVLRGQLNGIDAVIPFSWRIARADPTPHRYAESEGSNFDEEDDSEAEAPRKH